MKLHTAGRRRLRRIDIVRVGKNLRGRFKKYLNVKRKGKMLYIFHVIFKPLFPWQLLAGR